MQKKIPGKPIIPSPGMSYTYKSSPSLPSNWMVKSKKYQKINPVVFKSAPIAKVKPQNPNSMDVMQRTLDGTRKGGYKGANFIK